MQLAGRKLNSGGVLHSRGDCDLFAREHVLVLGGPIHFERDRTASMFAVGAAPLPEEETVTL